MTLLSEKIVIARKPHPCSVCTDTAIQPGDTYVRSAIADGGTVYVWLMCEECRAITGDVWEWTSYTEDGIGPEEYAEWASEHPNDPRSIALYERMGWER